MWALKYIKGFVKTSNLEMLYLVFGNEVKLDISVLLMDGFHPWFLFTRFFFFFLLPPCHLGLSEFHPIQVTQFCSLSDFIEQRGMKRDFKAIKAQRQG
jgi:hypothetical protein